MNLGIPAGEAALLVGALLAAGLVTGLLSGMLGIGGGVFGTTMMTLFDLGRRCQHP